MHPDSFEFGCAIFIVCLAGFIYLTYQQASLMRWGIVNVITIIIWVGMCGLMLSSLGWIIWHLNDYYPLAKTVHPPDHWFMISRH
jgi:hypothetical protein